MFFLVLLEILENVDVFLPHCDLVPPRHPFDRLIIEFRRWKASLSSKKGGRSKRFSLGNQINHYDGNLVVGQNYNTRQTYLNSPYSKDESRKVKEVFNKKKRTSYIGAQIDRKSNEGAQTIRRKRSFARHRNVLKGRAGGRGRGQQFRFIRIMMEIMRVMMIMMKMMRMRRLI